MINSLRLLFIAVVLFLTIGIFASVFAQSAAPKFSDSENPNLASSYLIDNLSNNSITGDLTLRINKKAPFDCKMKSDCPASLIVSNFDGSVNLPTAVNVGSFYVGKSPVIDSTGRWVGSPTGLVGPQGPKGDNGATGLQGIQGEKGERGEQGVRGPQGLQGPEGHQGVKGDTGITGAQGPKGETGVAGPQGPRGDTGLAGMQGPKGDIGPIGPQGQRGDTGATGLTGPKGDTGAAGQTGTKGDPGEGCSISENGDVACGDGSPVSVVGPRGPAGSFAGCFNQYSVTTEIFDRIYSATAVCPASAILTGGGCSISNLDLYYMAPQNTGQSYNCRGTKRDSSKDSSVFAVAICCVKGG